MQQENIYKNTDYSPINESHNIYSKNISFHYTEPIQHQTITLIFSKRISSKLLLEISMNRLKPSTIPSIISHIKLSENPYPLLEEPNFTLQQKHSAFIQKSQPAISPKQNKHAEQCIHNKTRINKKK